MRHSKQNLQQSSKRTQQWPQPSAPCPRCALCEREVSEVTRHHLIPQSRHNKPRNKRSFSREEVKMRIALLCRPCHKNLHIVFTNKQLEFDFNTLDKLRQHPDVQKFTNWIKNKPDGTVVPFSQRKK